MEATKVTGSQEKGWEAKVVFRPYIGEPGHLIPGASQRHTLTLVGLRGAKEPVWFVSSLASENIVVESPAARSQVSSPLEVSGQARAYEANVLVEIRDDKGKVLHPRPGREEGFLTTADAHQMAPFRGSLAFESPSTPAGILILRGDAGAGPSPDITVVRLRFGPEQASGPQGQAKGPSRSCPNAKLERVSDLKVRGAECETATEVAAAYDAKVMEGATFPGADPLAVKGFSCRATPVGEETFAVRCDKGSQEIAFEWGV